ncbi:YdcF family protein [Paenibacillus puerhi]|uniref:YdcF family protein n=1 Tax=Paenibacillus puerhi TaxID=2692622 RepID=UPI00135B87D8|nr:YdcF family protein [Paenibacillus puerhi]
MGRKDRIGWRRAAGRAVRLLALGLLMAILGVGGIQWQMSAMPDKPLDPVDVGIVLGAALWQDEPSPALKERLDRAVKLYLSGVTPRLIVSGGYDHEDSLISEAEGMRNYLVRKGVAAEHIALEQASRSTYENLKFSQAVMERHGWSSAAIITHRYHALRALDIARYLGYRDPVASPMDSDVLMMSWHRSRETLAIYKWEWDKLQLAVGREPLG